VKAPLVAPHTDDDVVIDRHDLDSDHDGIPDAVEGLLDSDNDGVFDRHDLDSDNDGLLDAIEASGNGAIPVDSDDDGYLDHLDHDIDENGIPDVEQPQEPLQAIAPAVGEIKTGLAGRGCSITGTGPADPSLPALLLLSVFGLLLRSRRRAG